MITGADGAVVSMVILACAEGWLVLPAASVAVVTKVWAPEVSVPVGMLNTP